MAMFGWTDPKMPAHYIAQANREKFGFSGMDKVVVFDRSASLDGFCGEPGRNETPERSGNIPGNIRKKSFVISRLNVGFWCARRRRRRGSRRRRCSSVRNLGERAVPPLSWIIVAFRVAAIVSARIHPGGKIRPYPGAARPAHLGNKITLNHPIFTRWPIQYPDRLQLSVYPSAHLHPGAEIGRRWNTIFWRTKKLDPKRQFALNKVLVLYC